MRTATDFSPLYRSFIGFDHLAGLIDKASRADKQPSYPPYNVELLAEDQYRITMAIAGFAEQELDIESKQDTLIVTGTKSASDSNKERKYLHQGIADRNFERKFQLGEHVKVIGAFIEHGLLSIDLEREIPEALKPRKIAINGKSLLQQRNANVIEKN
ncbi:MULTISPECIES: Hsp20 family protein [unclassified Colwellia]|jgi:molecular chaperone IbpA|uniref:Hsp20 family protein n=1 Tax=unclassified Colwellia TaxID=196834 RepID=UPI0015F716DE|nr:MULTISPECIES: Hsp20 family protein [unclassified Colwellia]MBA6223933.1 Hsp20 family protein [Colwellia sp. MB3u-45]MBA6267360.1 Hsp20 family protein [Colwellia sp. MB3u-43]MBA6289402.1 Hsp20 family protein [Colwellia sp. MB3u-4]MBA6297503.1 Hsp20 family protein [Colwellia sp. MB02u-9]MBA6320114.1 Hsp20 family protein [Colwellia sp. MB02u-19]